MTVNTSPVDIGDLGSSIHCDMGGSWNPPDCRASQRVAVVVPYRDRAPMVGVWLRHIHDFLQRQQLSYRIFIVEQV